MEPGVSIEGGRDMVYAEQESLFKRRTVCPGIVFFTVWH